MAVCMSKRIGRAILQIGEQVSFIIERMKTAFLHFERVHLMKFGSDRAVRKPLELALSEHLQIRFMTQLLLNGGPRNSFGDLFAFNSWRFRIRVLWVVQSGRTSGE